MGFFDMFKGEKEAVEPKPEMEVVKSDSDELDKEMTEYFDEEEKKYEDQEPLPSDSVKWEDLGKDDENLEEAA